MSETESSTSEDGTEPEVEVNEDAVEQELGRRTVELEVPIDDVHANAADQLQSAGVPLEDVLADRLRPAVEGAIHDILQQSKYSE